MEDSSTVSFKQGRGVRWTRAQKVKHPIVAGMRRCPVCEEYKEATRQYFSPSKVTKDGCAGICKTCGARKRREKMAGVVIARQPAIKDRLQDGKLFCLICEEWLPASPDHFTRRAASPSGFNHACKRCWNKTLRGLPDQEGTRQCYGCGEIKPLSEEYFYPGGKARNGYYSTCRVCQAAYKRAAYAATPELYKKRAREDRLRNLPRTKEASKRWAANNRDKVRAILRNRKARLKMAEGSHTSADIQKRLKSQAYKCHWCGAALKLSGDGVYHVDHLIPLVKGGSNNPSNLVCSCPSCNLSKGSKLPHEWIGRLF